MRPLSLLSTIVFSALISAHPGADHTAELAARREYFLENRADLSHCAQKLEADGVTKRAEQRRGLAARDLHAKRSYGFDMVERDKKSFDPSHFASNNSCVLAPEEILGPYYVAGEYVRCDLAEEQIGVPLTLDIQFIDSKTCTPVEGKYVEIWSCNSTGVYGGVLAAENGNGLSDPQNVYNTWLRGVQKTDEDGVVQFNTLFPGHYTGRTNHLHVLVHPNASPLPNGTLLSTTASYVGQMYFDQDLAYAVEKYAPYTENKQPWTTNDQDEFLQLDLKQGGNPFVTYHKVGEELSDGILGWLSYGIDVQRSESVTPTRTYEPACPTN